MTVDSRHVKSRLQDIHKFQLATFDVFRKIDMKIDYKRMIASHS